MQVDKVYLATAQSFQFVMYVAQNEIVCVLDVYENIQVTMLVLFTTSHRAKDSNSSDSKLLCILFLVMLDLPYVVCSRIHC